MFNRTTMVLVDFTSARNLDSIKHRGPSSIDIDTLVLSKGDLPEIFLRGAGVPEPFIINLKSLIGAVDPIRFYSCSISYFTKDQDYADRLHAGLQTQGVRCWLAPHDVQGGRKLDGQIDEAIRSTKAGIRDKARVLFLISLSTPEAQF